MRLLSGLGRILDGIAEAMGGAGMLLILYCMSFGVSDVFMRYVLNAPSLWIGTTIHPHQRRKD